MICELVDLDSGSGLCGRSGRTGAARDTETRDRDLSCLRMNMLARIKVQRSVHFLISVGSSRQTHGEKISCVCAVVVVPHSVLVDSVVIVVWPSSKSSGGFKSHLMM